MILSAKSSEENVIQILQNGKSITFSFGLSQPNDRGFWKYRANLPITIKYTGWFGNHYVDTQNVKFIDSDSFTGFLCGGRS